MTRFICRKCGGDVEVEATRIGGEIRVGCKGCLEKLDTLQGVVAELEKVVAVYGVKGHES